MTTLPPLTLEAARTLQSTFGGRITSGHDAHGEFGGKPTILIPASASDVGLALRLSRAANRRVSVRSGQSVSSTDVKHGTAAIVSMEAFRRIDVRAKRVTVGAAATTADVAMHLAKKGLFLPLDDNPTQSIVSAVLSMDGSPFLRSGDGLGPLRGAVAAAEVVPIDGKHGGVVKTLRDDALRELWAGRRRAIITKLVFDPAAWTKDASNRWTQAWMTIYNPKSFAALCGALFGQAKSAIPERVDLTLRVTSAAFSMKLVLVRATGHGNVERKAAEAAIKDALARARCIVFSSERVTGPGESVAAWAATGASSASGQANVQRRFGSNAAPRPFASFRRALLDAIDFALGVDAATGRTRAPAIEAWAELQLTPNGKVLARAQMADANATPSIAKEARERMAQAIPADDSAVPTVAPLAQIRRATARTALRDVEVMAEFMPTADFDLSSSKPIGEGIIPGFEGNVFAKAGGGEDYGHAVQQYAVSSYPAAVVESRMRPRYVAEPEHAEDVAKAVDFAVAKGLKVVVRSGGHQYCGLSSGGDDTLVLDMGRFVDVTFSPNVGVPTQVTVGPGVALRDLSADLRGHQVTLPHGECPLVNIGGHVQTGGIGHLLRSLGATLDWVRSFKMVTRDPLSMGAGVYAELEFTRPNAENPGPPTDDDVFRAVLGGGPGSWGVLTEVTFDLVPDSAFPAHGYSRTYLYDRDGFRAAMEQLRQWAVRAVAGKLPEGMDLFLTVVSGANVFTPGVLGRPAVLLVETMCVNAAREPEIKAVVNAVEKALPLGAGVVAWLADPVNGRADLSFIADVGVRKIGLAGLPKSGREFDLPYKKSLYLTKTPFTAAFRDRFVDLVHRVNEQDEDGLKVVFQAVVGGGAFRGKGPTTTHMQRRDGLVQLVFDVFYEPGKRAQAESFQAEMKALLPEYSGNENVRMFWGTFEDKGANGAQLDMSDPKVQELYYDSVNEYARLQQIKQYIDPGDVFHTSFTVQLP